MKEKLKSFTLLYSTILYKCMTLALDGPFLETPTHFSGPRANFKIKTC